jgi:hypothetical protein
MVSALPGPGLRSASTSVVLNPTYPFFLATS